MSKGQYLLETPLQSRQPWIYQISSCNKLGGRGFQRVSINKCNTDIYNLKGALSKFKDRFAIKEKFYCKNQDLKMFKILNAEQLPILQIVKSIFIWGLNWLDIWVEHSWLGLAFWITKIALLLRVLEDFVTEQSVQWECMSTFQFHNALVCQEKCTIETETYHCKYT